MGDEETKTSTDQGGGEGKNKSYEEEEYENRLQLGPMFSIKDHLEMDKVFLLA